MKRNARVHQIHLVLFFAVSLILTSAVSVASAAESGTVTGTVEVDGQPVPGAEVFLWVGYPRHTCTDSAGEFEFGDVPFGDDLFSATGFGNPEFCDNWRFLAPDGGDLITDFYGNFSITAQDPEYHIDYTPRRPQGDEVVCAANVATVVGTDGDDVLTTGPGASIVHGGGGNDIIKGSSESFEYLCGGPGRDTIYGYGGGDTLMGGPGFDRLFGGGGFDLLFGGGGRDIIHGGPGGDIIWGEAGNDKLWGEGGKDLIRGLAGNDVMRGNRGMDILLGGSGDDSAYGGPGKDVCKAEKKVSC